MLLKAETGKEDLSMDGLCEVSLCFWTILNPAFFIFFQVTGVFFMQLHSIKCDLQNLRCISEYNIYFFQTVFILKMYG